jgi:hypothetical protein
MVNASVMEMRMILAMVARSIQAIESAQRELEIQHRDLTRQAEWIKEEIRKVPPPDWVIEIESVNGPCYVNEDLEGDPGRTCDLAHAERYATENEARENYHALCRKYPNRKFKPVRLPA